MNSIRMCGCARIRFERGSESTRDLSVLVSDLILQRFEDDHYLFLFLFVQGLLVLSMAAVVVFVEFDFNY